MKIDVLLVPRVSVDSAQQGVDLGQYEQATQLFVSGLMLFPVHNRMKNKPYFPDRDLVRRLLAECDVESPPFKELVAFAPRKTGK